MKKKVIVAIAVLLSAGILFAYEFVIGGTNFGYSGYPEFSNLPPSRPYSTIVSSTISEREYSQYRDSVEDYINDAEIYIENACNDIKRILNEIEEAEDETNQVINDFNSWSETVTVTEDDYYF